MVTAIEPAIAPDNMLSKGEQRHLGALERRIASGLQTFREVGAALLEIRDSRLYRETHATFEAYCTERWAMPRARAYQLIDSAKVVKALGDPGELANEAQARELVQLADQPDVAKQVFSVAKARAEETAQPLTASLIARVRDEVVAPTTGRAVETPTERLMSEVVRLAQAYERWKATKPTASERQKVKAAVSKLLSVIG